MRLVRWIRHHHRRGNAMMTFRLIFDAAVVQRTLAVAGASLLFLGLSSASLPLTWHYMPSALADPGGKWEGQ